ncbi:hypothetical protein MCOR21_007591 [Pyricularia oryzae]|nr:hypothetical protein MCOR26_004953 [Pyricularia oryzae]KAI6346315.1 hypothetical protein MCOR28_003046 [Pyricularia oryzae]KAI6424667.1 hypothetical protein MCOR21_007591 [Pyricularia oryzae]KAI6472460.1 hypothetical protein MCOR15_000429 [Pyricularia oryzae]KAI6538830.1 hypothetical protein MCOR16_001587 [Pyricularia oryzae]
MEQTTNNLDWTLNGEPKIRDGRYGPVFLAMDTKTGQLLSAEQLEFDRATLEAAVSQLAQKFVVDSDAHNLVRYLGCHTKGEHTYLVAEHVNGSSLTEMLRNYGPIPAHLVRSIVRSLLTGLDWLHAHGSYTKVLLDPDYIFVDQKGAAKIDIPVLDPVVAGCLPPPASLALPELGLGQGGPQKANVWLLGIVVAHMLSGEAKLAVDYTSAASLGAGLISCPGSAVGMVLPEHVVKLLLEEPLAFDFVRKCLTVKVAGRPGISKLQTHAFLSAS